MKKNRLLVLAAVLMGTALLSTSQSADARCIPGLCYEVDENTVCCWSDSGCILECWDW
jgi:hypothetical protein